MCWRDHFGLKSQLFNEVPVLHLVCVPWKLRTAIGWVLLLPRRRSRFIRGVLVGGLRTPVRVYCVLMRLNLPFTVFAQLILALYFVVQLDVRFMQ